MILEPKDVPITGPDGKVRTFILSKFPAVAGREICAKYPVSLLPKLGDYDVSEATMLKLMCYVGVRIKDRPEPLMLTTMELVNNHTHDWETLFQIEMGMLDYNASFFGNGKSLAFFASTVETLKAWILSTLTDLSVASSRTTKQRSKNSKRRIR